MTAPAKIDIAASHRERVGCSNIAQALGVSMWGTQYQLWEQYTGRAPWPDIGNELRVALGEPMEDVLRPFVAAKLGRELRRDRREYLHPTLPLIGHVDYRASALDGEKRPIVDMKTSLGWGAKHRFGVDGTDEVDDDVLLQMQGYTLLTGAAIAYVAALVPGPELKLFTIAADPDMHGMIADGLENFWWHVTNDVAPDITTQADANRRWAKHTAGKTADADAASLAILEHLRAAKARSKTAEKEQDALELVLKTLIGDAEALLGADGKPLCTWKTQANTRIDTTRLKAEAPELYKTYAEQSTSRVLRLKGEK